MARNILSRAETKRALVRTEHEEAAELMRRLYVLAHEPGMAELSCVFHVPNGGARPGADVVTKRGGRIRVSGAGTQLKAEGVMVGVPDYLLLVPRDGYHWCAVELKAHGGAPTILQVVWMMRHGRHGLCAIAWGAEAAAYVFTRYLQGRTAELTDMLIGEWRGYGPIVAVGRDGNGVSDERLARIAAAAMAAAGGREVV